MKSCIQDIDRKNWRKITEQVDWTLQSKIWEDITETIDYQLVEPVYNKIKKEKL